MIGCHHKSNTDLIDTKPMVTSYMYDVTVGFTFFVKTMSSDYSVSRMEPMGERWISLRPHSR